VRELRVTQHLNVFGRRFKPGDKVHLDEATAKLFEQRGMVQSMTSTAPIVPASRATRRGQAEYRTLGPNGRMCLGSPPE
jgi:hypothetical protein